MAPLVAESSLWAQMAVFSQVQPDLRFRTSHLHITVIHMFPIKPTSFSPDLMVRSINWEIQV